MYHFFPGLVPSQPVPEYGILVVCMKMIQWLSYHVVPGIMIIAVVLELDPLFLSLQFLPSLPLANLASLVFRAVFMFLLVNELFKAVNTYFIIGLMVVSAMNDFVTKLNRRKKMKSVGFDLEVVPVLRELQIWNSYTNKHFCYFSVPPLILFGVSFIILGSFGSIRMVGMMSWILYPVIPITTGICIVFVFTLLPVAAGVYENSRVYITQFRQTARSKLDKMVAKTLKPMAIGIGPFGRVDNGLKQNIITYWMECTSNLLITFKL